MSVVALLSLASLARAESPSIERVEIGFRGQYTVGRWVPVRILLRTVDEFRGDVVVDWADGDGVMVRYSERNPVLLSPDSEHWLVRYVKPGRLRGNLTVRLVPERGAATERNLSVPEPNPSTRRIILTIGPDIGVDQAVERHVRGPLRYSPTVHLGDADELPDRWYGYDAVHTLVMSNGENDFLESLAPARKEAIVRWVRMGGRVVFCCGREGEALLARESPWRDLAPGTFDRIVRQRRFGALENYVGAVRRLDASEVGASVPMTLLADVRGRVEVAETVQATSYPLVIRHTVGFGHVVFCALDLDRPPLVDWDDRIRLAAALLRSVWPERPAIELESTGGKVLHEGFTDISGQFRGALDQIPGVRIFAFSWIVGLICAYILLIGPGDYFLLHRLLKRTSLTWITFPLLVVGFSGLAYYLSGSFKGNRPRINQVDVVDIDTESSLVRGTSWATLYSPTSREFDLSLTIEDGDFLAARGDRLLSWFGQPGEGFGGMDTATAAGVVHSPYDVVTESPRDGGPVSTSIRGMPIAVASTKSVVGRWWARAESSDTGRLTFDSFRLRGTIKNPLPVTLENCMVAHGETVYSLGDKWMPGGELSVEDATPRSLERSLTGNRVRLDQAAEEPVPWSAAGTDVARVVEIMMFHDAAGGRSYTNLTHRYLDFIDLTRHARSGHAVVVGRSDRPATLLRDPRGDQLAAESRHWTFYRLILPVVETKRPSRRD